MIEGCGAFVTEGGSAVAAGLGGGIEPGCVGGLDGGARHGYIGIGGYAGRADAEVPLSPVATIRGGVVTDIHGPGT
jgi:hypothetical protein